MAQSELDLGELRLVERLLPAVPAGADPLQPLAPEIARFLETFGRFLHFVERRFEQLRLFQEVLTQANAGIVLDEILDHIYLSFHPLIPYDRLGLALVEGEGEGPPLVRCRWARGPGPGEIRLGPGYGENLGATSLAAVFAGGRPRILNDLVAHLAGRPGSESTRLLVQEGMRSSLTCPLIAMGSPVGFLFFSSKEPGIYGEVHTDTFAQLAGEIAMIVEKGRLYEQLQRTNARLQEEIRQRSETEDLLLRTQRELVDANRELDRLASIDGLTGVANRRAFDEALRAAWLGAPAGAQPVSVVLADVDHFKAYNDAHGHIAGDECLRAVGQALRGASRGRQGDVVARYGGEEFAILLPGVVPGDAAKIAERVHRAVADLKIPREQGAATGSVSISVGVATRIPGPGDDSSLLIADADRALYAAKSAGRDRVVRHDG